MKQAPALRSNNQTHPPRTHRPWHRRTRSPRSAVGTTAPGRPDDALLGPSTCVNGCQFVSTAGGGMAAECHRHWSGSLLGMLGDIGAALAGLSLVGQVAVGEWAAVVMLMLAKAVGARRGAAVRAGVGLCARGCQQGGCEFVPPLPDRLGRIPGGQTGNFRKWIRFRCDLRLATATATLSLCWQAVRPSKYFPVTNLGGAREGARSKRCVSWVRFGFDSRFTAVSLEFVKVLVFVPRRWRESRGCRAARGARRGRCEWAQ